MAEYSRIAKGHVSSLGGATPVLLPFQPQVVRIRNYTAAGAPAQNGVPNVYWDVSMGQAYASYDYFNATPVLTCGNTPTGGISTFSAGTLLQYGALQTLGASGSITKASAAVVTTTADHGLVSGDVVIFQNLYQSATTGMQQIAGIPFSVTVTGDTTFTIPWNTNQSNYTALNGGSGTYGLNASFKQVLYPTLYAPGASVITAISTGTTTTVTTTAAHNFQVGQEIAFRIPTAWGTSQLNSLPNSVVPGSPIYGFVTAVGSATQFTCSINSTGYTAFNSNQVFASFPGEFFPQVVAVGDVNSGYGANSVAPNYPAPSVYLGTSTGTTSLPVGPAVLGAYINTTYAGFIIGANVAGAASDVLYYEAMLCDYAAN